MTINDSGPSARLFGTGPPPRGLFVGRSGALLLGPERATGKGLARASCSPMALRLLFRAAQRGWRLYLIGNEESVARGRVSDAAWERFESDLLERLTGEGIPIARHYACLDHPKGKGLHRRDSVFRFPNTGALFHAAQEDGIELRESWVIASEVDELAAGWRAGCRTVRIGTRAAERAARSSSTPGTGSNSHGSGSTSHGTGSNSHGSGSNSPGPGGLGVLDVETDLCADDLASAIAQVLRAQD